MNFPRYWAQARLGNFSSWRWSDTSVEEARALANQAVRKVSERFQVEGQAMDRYGYGDRALREPVLQEIRGAEGDLAAVVTRNSYGCRVLNTAGALFADVDLADEDAAPPSVGGLLGSLFGAKSPKRSDPADQAIGRAEEWARSQPGWNWRIYRTSAGLRLLATHRLFDPEDPFCQAVFDAVGADPLYRRLCGAQKCFRARLTPKPWRCGAGNPPASWPFVDGRAEQAFQEWNRRYEAASNGRATCQFVREVGSGQTDGTIQPLIAIHDRETRSASGMALA